jgi:hypothetical protein
MAKISVTPYITTDFSIKIGADNYEDAFSSAKLTPANTVATWKGGTKAAVFTAATAPTYTFETAVAHDWKAATSLSNYCLAHGGESVTIVFIPNAHDATGSKLTFTFTAIVPYVEAGGDIDAFAGSSLTWAVVGKPTNALT